MPFAKAGLLVGHGPATPTDLDMIRRAKLEALKLRAIANPTSDLAAYRDLGIQTFLVQMLSPEPGEQPTTPQAFVDYFARAVEGFVRAGVRDFEIHGEPNRPDRGYGISWDTPAAFGDWFVAVAEKLKTTFGPQVRAGFPGLTPPPPCQPGATPAIAESGFLTGCTAAIEEADYVCCHVYWNSEAEQRDLNGGMRFVRRYLETFKNKPLVISEFSNLSANVPGADKGDQYAEFYLTCAQYDACFQDWPGNPADWPRVQAAYAFILRSPDPVYDSQAWMYAEGQSRAIAERVAVRSRMPHPTAMRFAWPSEFRHYTQFYGENQQLYYDNSAGHSLRGGHNGADLHVNTTDPASSPIRSCLDGVVTRKLMHEDGYGHHAYIASQAEGVGRVTLLYGHMTHVTVNEGDTVQAGQPIGTAGRTGWSSGPHLHLSLKINGVKLPPNGNHLNPRSYLDPTPPPRGQPRVDYARTYVLLPPQANAAWARAVVGTVWDAHRFTIGSSADDAGIGDLDFRRVVAVNPAAWGEDDSAEPAEALHAFFETHYPGAIYTPIEADAPDRLKSALKALPEPSALPMGGIGGERRGQPRVDYARTYVLLPPQADAAWARAVVDAAWDTHRFTIGGSADDAGIGDLDFRRVIAVNPAAWGDDLFAFFEAHYPGALYVPVEVHTPQELKERLTEW
jgi:murein DD-endopeptidase MepM/ murein hydrolase activator NlpD